MFDKPGEILQSTSGASGIVQQAVIGNNVKQVAGIQGATPDANKQLSREKAVALLQEIEEILRNSTLPESTKEDAVAYLIAAKRATDKEEPKKDIAAINLKEMVETLEGVNKTVDASKNLWHWFRWIRKAECFHKYGLEGITN